MNLYQHLAKSHNHHIYLVIPLLLLSQWEVIWACTVHFINIVYILKVIISQAIVFHFYRWRHSEIRFPVTDTGVVRWVSGFALSWWHKDCAMVFICVCVHMRASQNSWVLTLALLFISSVTLVHWDFCFSFFPSPAGVLIIPLSWRLWRSTCENTQDRPWYLVSAIKLMLLWFLSQVIASKI